MINRSKEIFEVGVDDPLGSRAQLLPDLSHGILGQSPFAVSEAGIIEYRLEDRLQPRASAHSCMAWAVWRDGPRLDILDSVFVIGLLHSGVRRPTQTDPRMPPMAKI